MDFKELATNVSAAEEGVYFPMGEDGAEIKIAMWGNKAHKKFLRAVYAKHGRKIDAKAISDEQSDEIMAPQWNYIVKDWRGFTNDGKPFPFSQNTLQELVRDKKYRSFFERIATISRDEANFRENVIQELGEASPTT